MHEGPLFVAVPPLRCQRVTKNSPRTICGELAAWMEPGSDLFMPSYLCEKHHDESCVRIPETGVMRRVSIQVEVLFAGASWVQTEAKAEAVARLERAVEQAGGLLSLTAASSTMGRFDVQAAAARTNEPAGDRR